MSDRDCVHEHNPDRPEPTDGSGPAGFHHECLLHRGDTGFAAAVVPFLRAAAGRSEPVLVAVGPRRVQILAEALGADAASVRFLDMRVLGANPARIIPAWSEFLERHPDRHVLGVGEPVWPGRGAEELSECRLHEALLNVAFGAGRPWRLLCPYDVDALPAAVIAGAHDTHPLVSLAGGAAGSGRYAAMHQPFAGELPRPPAEAVEIDFSLGELPAVRSSVAAAAEEAALPVQRAEDLVLAVSELAANSVCYGGGTGTLLAWEEGDTVVCEVRDRGLIRDPLAGRRRPGPDQRAGRGLWIANQLCDLVQIRSSSAAGTRVRVRMGMASG